MEGVNDLERLDDTILKMPNVGKKGASKWAN